MPYATQSDMLVRYGETELRQLSDIGTPRLGTVDSSVIARALADASAWIDSYLVGRYPLPITDAGALATLNLHCAAEARYLLMTASPDDQAVKGHEERERYLRSIAKGEINLIAPAAAPAAEGVGDVLWTGGSKLFGRDSYGGGAADDGL
jgi:phage gp36-like protein